MKTSLPWLGDGQISQDKDEEDEAEGSCVADALIALVALSQRVKQFMPAGVVVTNGRVKVIKEAVAGICVTLFLVVDLVKSVDRCKTRVKRNIIFQKWRGTIFRKTLCFTLSD